MRTRTKVYCVHYSLKNKLGEVVDTSIGGEPLTFLEGSENVIAGIQKAVQGRSPGEQLEVTIPPELAYGEPRTDLIKRVPRSLFDGIEELKVGMKFQTNTGQDAQVVVVKYIDGDLITVDANHPLAGLTLYFDLHIVSVREATNDELELNQALPQ